MTTQRWVGGLLLAVILLNGIHRGAFAGVVFSENFEAADTDAVITPSNSVFTTTTFGANATVIARVDSEVSPFFSSGTKYLEYLDASTGLSQRLQKALPAEAADPMNAPDLKQITNSGFQFSFDFYEPIGIGPNSVRVGVSNGSFTSTGSRMVELVIYAPSETELGDAGYINGSGTQQNFADSAFAPDTLHHIDVIGIVGTVPGGSISYEMNGEQSVANNTYDIWVDGVRLADDATFRNTFSTITEFAILNSSASSQQTVYFDNIALWNEIPSAIVVPGDFNNDGNVDGTDFGLWQMNFPTASNASLGMGDADGDGDVDGADFVVWQTNYAGESSSTTLVPEPQSLFLVIVGSMGAFVFRRRRVSELRGHSRPFCELIAMP
jgi:hypothetical protein